MAKKISNRARNFREASGKSRVPQTTKTSDSLAFSIMTTYQYTRYSIVGSWLANGCLLTTQEPYKLSQLTVSRKYIIVLKIKSSLFNSESQIPTMNF